MRNMAVLHSPAFSYPLPVLVRVLFNLLIFKGKILYYNKYNQRCVQNKTNTLVFHTESYLISRFGKDLLLFCSGSEGTIIYSIPNTRSIVTK